MSENINGEDESDWRDGLLRDRTQRMLERCISTDCTFVVGPEEGETKEFKAHRFLLFNASAVFEKMLTGEMVEAKTGHVRVTDLSPNTFKLLLRFVYADEAKMATFEEARDVALAADKYQLKLLFEQCLSSMCDHVTSENVWTALKFVQLLPHQPLKRVCLKVMQEETRKCIVATAFLQADEEDVALLLEQDELNVESELMLVVAVIKWAQNEVMRRKARGSDEGVRDVLQPRLLPLLRWLTFSPKLFTQTFKHGKFFTAEELWAINVCLHTEDSSVLPPFLSANKEPRKRQSSVFYCQRKVLSSLGNLSPSFNQSSTLIFRIKCDVELKLVGFQIPSQVLEDPTKLISPEHSYDETLKIEVHSYGCSLLHGMAQLEKLIEFDFTERVAYNSKISIFFPQPVVLEKEKWYKILKVFRKVGQYPIAQLETNVVCPNVPFRPEFDFHTRKMPHFLCSVNDGFFRALSFSL